MLILQIIGWSLLVIGIIIGILFIAFYKPYWYQIYEFTNFAVGKATASQLTPDYQEAIIYELDRLFHIEEQDAWECIRNWNNKEWFKQKFRYDD